jgi:hypothetical protein
MSLIEKLVWRCVLGIITDILNFMLSNNIDKDDDHKEDCFFATELSISDNLSASESVFYAYNDDSDQVPFELGNDDVGYYNDISSHCQDFNIDGTAMIDCTFDINGDVFGDPSSLHDDMFSESCFDNDMFSSCFDDDDSF